jgi:hypothetical protein
LHKGRTESQFPLFLFRNKKPKRDSARRESGEILEAGYGFRCEIVLRRFGIVGFSYAHAGVLEKDIVHARDFAKRAIQRKIGTCKFHVQFLKSDEAKTLCVHALGLDIGNDENFRVFVEEMEKVVDLLGLKIRR